MKLVTTVESVGKSTTGLRIPDEVVLALGAGRRPAVRVTLNGYTYRTSIASLGGVFRISVSAEVRTIAHVAAGDEVEIVVELDHEPRVVAVPTDLAAALDDEPEARRRFDRLAYSHQLRHVLAVEAARTPSTRARRIAAVLDALLTDETPHS